MAAMSLLFFSPRRENKEAVDCAATLAAAHAINPGSLICQRPLCGHRHVSAGQWFIQGGTTSTDFTLVPPCFQGFYFVAVKAEFSSPNQSQLNVLSNPKILPVSCSTAKSLQRKNCESSPWSTNTNVQRPIL